MRTKKILFYFFIVLTVLLFMSALGSFFFHKEKEAVLKETLSVQQRNVSQLIADQVRGDLLIDNTLEVERKLNLLIRNGTIENFKLYKSKTTVDNSKNANCNIVFFDNDKASSPWGMFCVDFPTSQRSINNLLLRKLTTIAISFIVFFILFIIYIFKQISQFNNELSQGVSQTIDNPEKTNFNHELWGPILNKLKEEVQRKNLAEKLLTMKQIEADKIKIAMQVSHDIRSPLAALNMMMEETAEIPEDNRIIIRSAVNRINDIANQLLDKGKSKNTAEDLNDKTIISTHRCSGYFNT